MEAIMIVDDDPDDRFFFRRAVEQMGPSYEYYGAQHGVEALEYLGEAQKLPDFILIHRDELVEEFNLASSRMLLW